MENNPAHKRKIRRGIVVSDKMNKTVVVKVERLVLHPMYKKYVKRSKTFFAHDEENTAHVGDQVQIVETRPLSKKKHWRVSAIVSKAIADIKEETAQ